MLYAADTIGQIIAGEAQREAERAAGSNDLISKTEQKNLPADLQAAANRVRDQKGKGARITVAEVVAEHSRHVEDSFSEVNKVGSRWLSANETSQLPDDGTRLRAWDVRAKMKRGANLADERAADGYFRREINDRYVHNGEDAIKVAFFDADSTLRVSLSGSVSANGPDDVQILPFVGPTISELVEQGYLIVVISNQAGVSAGFVEFADADAALETAADHIRTGGGDVHYMDFAEARDHNRKPETGMAERLEQKLKEAFGDSVFIDKETSFMVGDSAYKATDTRPDGGPGNDFSHSDRLFAENFGIPFHEPNVFFEWSDHGTDDFRWASEVTDFWARLRD